MGFLKPKRVYYPPVAAAVAPAKPATRAASAAMYAPGTSRLAAAGNATQAGSDVLAGMGARAGLSGANVIRAAITRRRGLIGGSQ